MLVEEETILVIKNLVDTLKSLQRTLYALRDDLGSWLLADLLNRPGPLWLAGLDLARVDLSQMDLKCANLRKTDLEQATLVKADLRGANLAHANLSGANLAHANLRDANLEGADLSEANLDEADLSDSNLSGANLDKAKKLEKALLKGATLPDGTVFTGVERGVLHIIN